MTRDLLVGQHLALLLMGHDEGGNDDWAVLSGTIVEEAGRILFQHEGGPLHLSDEWLARIRQCPSEVKSVLLDADVYLPLTVGTLSSKDAAILEKTNIRWPSA